MAKQLIGALIGGIIGAGIMIAFEQSQQREMAWTVVFVGVLAGLGARMMGTGRSFVAGALAALLTIVCFAGGKFGASYVIRQAAEKPQLVVSTETEVDDSESETEGDEAVADSSPLMDDRDMRLADASNTTVQNLDYSAKQSPLDTVWLVVGTAIAYLIGRGSGPAPGAAAGDEVAGAGGTEGGSPETPAPNDANEGSAQ